MPMITSSGLALGSSLTGGASDFLSGSTSRLTGTTPFMCCSQAIGVALVAGWIAASGDGPPGVRTLALAAAAGLGLTVALGGLIQQWAVLLADGPGQRA